MHSPILFVMDPNLLRDIMVKDFDVWATRGITVNLDVDPLSVHLINLNGNRWKSVRTKLTPTLTSGKLRQMHHLLLECGKKFEKHLNAVAEKGQPIEAKEMAAKFTTDVIGSRVFGIQINSLSDEDALFRKMGKKIFRATFKKRMIRVLQSSFPRILKLLNLAAVNQEFTEFFVGIVKESFESREKNNVQRHDFIDLLKQLKNTNEKLGDDEMVFDDTLLAAQAFVFFGAGFETSAGAISYCLHELAINQNVQDRFREEIHMTKAANNGEIMWDVLKNTKYLDMVLQETLRKHSPITVSTRMSVKPYRIPGTEVDLPCGGTACFIPIYALHHDPKFFPNPEKFDPERFSEEAKSQRSTPCFIPFGDGPRHCIGSRFVNQQAKLGLFTVIDKFEVSLCEKSEYPLQHNPEARFLSPKNGIWVSISPYNPK